MNIQLEIFDHIRSKRSDGLSFAKELSNLLSISLDSAYRRLRGDTIISMDELTKICNHYSISSDTFIKGNKNDIIFQESWLLSAEFGYTNYLKKLREEVDLLDKEPKSTMFYSAKDMPFFYFLMLPEISEFKGFFWEKTLVQLPSHKDKKFSCSDIDPERARLTEEIVSIFNNTNTIELWSDEILNSTIKQIKFNYESGFFASSKDLEILIDQLAILVDHMEQQADAGCKFKIGSTPETRSNNFLLYYSDVLIGDNTIILDLNGKKIMYRPHNIIHTICSMDQAFCTKTWNMHESFLNSSTLISISSQKDRLKFFNGLRAKVDDLRKYVDRY